MTGYMEERPGVKSNMRLMSVISLFASILFALITLSGRAGDTNTGLIITAMFLAGAFCPKVVQKFAEGIIIAKGGDQ